MNTMVIETKYALNQIVYLVTDPDQLCRLITQIIVCANGAILYKLSQGLNETLHYESEISDQKVFA